jgi:hemerythrin superfamily protein
MTTATTEKPARTRRAPARKPATPKAAPKAEAATKSESSGSRSLGTGAVLGVAAAGIAAGLVANLGRKAAVQAPSALAGDWFELIKAEHKMALVLFDKLQATEDSQTWKRSTLLTQLKHALGKHAFTEENVIYPALRDLGEKADADQLNHEHGYVKQFLYDLENMPKDSAGFLPMVAEFRREIEHHMEEEEQRIFPPMHERLGPEKNKQVTVQANKEGFKLA